MKSVCLWISLAAVMSATQAEAAGTYTLNIEDWQSPRHIIKRVKVEGGVVTGLPPINEQKMRVMPLTVKLDGKCYTRVSVWLEALGRKDIMMDICAEKGLFIN